MGERSPIWDSSARGLILGLSLVHTKGHLYKAFMEGVAYSLRHNMEMVLGTDAKLDKELIIVGGGSKSMNWPQIYADVTGYPVRIIKNDVEAPLGDAVLAGIATGIIPDPHVLKDWLEFEEPIQPNPENTKIYDQYYEEYKKLYVNAKDIMKRVTNIDHK
jgi:sugar (pentulose or hexulose) kinase